LKTLEKLKNIFQNNKRLQVLLAFLLFLAFALIYFNDIFTGYYYDPSSFLKLWEPWYSVIEGDYLVNAVLSDAIDDTIPAYIKFYSDPSLWNSDIAFGYPLGLMIYRNVFFPVNLILFSIFAPQLALTLSYIWKVVFAGLFMYLFLKKYKFSFSVAFLGGILYMFCSQMMITKGQLIGFLIPLIPLYFLAIKRVFEEKAKFKLLLLSVSTSLMLLSGFPSLVAFTFMFGGFYFLSLLAQDRKKYLSKLTNYIVGSIFGFLTIAFILLPTLEFFQNADLGYRENHWGRFFPTLNFMQFINPHFFGDPVLGTWSRASNIVETAGYMGIITLLLLPVSIFLIFKKRRKELYYFVIALLLLIAILFNFFGILQITRHLPIFNFNPANRLIYVVPFFAVTVTAFGFNYFQTTKDVFKNWLTTILLIIPFGLFVFLSIYIPDSEGTPEQVLKFKANELIPISEYILIFLSLAYLAITQKAHVALRVIFAAISAIFSYKLYQIIEGSSLENWENIYTGFTLITGAVAIALLLTLLANKKSAFFTALIIGILCFIDLYNYTHLFYPKTKEETFFPDTLETEFLQENMENNDRILSINRAFMQNTNTAYDIASIQVHMITTQDYKTLIREIDSEYLKYAPTLSFFREDSDLYTPFMDLFNVKYVVAGQGYSIDTKGLIYQTEYNGLASITEDKKIIQTFEFDETQSTDQISIRLNDYLVNEPKNLRVQLLNANDKEIYSDTIKVTPATFPLGWHYFDLGEDSLELKAGIQYKLSIDFLENLTQDEFANFNCVKEIDRYKQGELVDQECHDLAFKILEKIDNDRYELAFDGTIHIFENTSENRAGVFQIEKIDFLENSGEFEDKVDKEKVTSIAYLDAKDKADFEITEFERGSEDWVQFIEYDDDAMELEANFKNDGFILIPDTYYPGWKAFVDGEETEIYKTDLIFRGIKIPAGEHKIELQYEPESFRCGLLISGVSTILILGHTLYLLKNNFGKIRHVWNLRSSNKKRK